MRKFLLYLFSVIMVITCLNVVCFAADTDFYYGDLVVNDTTATVNLYFEPEADGTREYISALDAYYTVENGTVGDTNYTGEIPGMDSASSHVAGLISFYCDSYADASGPNIVNKFTITRVGNAATSVIKLKNVTVNDYLGDDISATFPETYTITWPSNEPKDVSLEEDFAATATVEGSSKTEDITSGTVSIGGQSIEMKEGGKVYTYFAKAANALKANKYGVSVKINEKVYNFPGIADVEAGAAWAIKLVVPEGSFADTAINSVGALTAYGNN